MFSSNQIFKMSGSLDQLEDTIRFAIRHAGCEDMFTRQDSPVSVAFQVTDTGLYCIGRGRVQERPGSTVPEHWHELPFDYDPAILAGIVAQHLAKHPADTSEYDGDGSVNQGFLCMAIEHTFDDRSLDGTELAGIKSACSGIIAIKSFANYYAK